jgi:hypothetical protein
MHIYVAGKLYSNTSDSLKLNGLVVMNGTAGIDTFQLNNALPLQTCTLQVSRKTYFEPKGSTFSRLIWKDGDTAIWASGDTAKVTANVTGDMAGTAGNVTTWLPSNNISQYRFKPSAANIAPTYFAVRGCNSDSVIDMRGTGCVDLKLNTNLRFTPAPDSCRPITGPVGTTITIRGKSWNLTQGSGKVYIGGTEATASAWSDTSITASAPSLSPAKYRVYIKSTFGDSSFTDSFTVSGIGSDTIPVISSLAPTHGLVGIVDTLNGTNFITAQGSGTVTYNGIGATVSSWNNTRVIVTVPSVTGRNVEVILTNNNSKKDTATFVLDTACVLDSIRPNHGTPLGGTIATLHGSFQRSGSVYFGATQNTKIQSRTATAIICTTLTGTGGDTLNVRVANTDGPSDTILKGWRYHRIPVVYAVDKDSVLCGGGDTVNICVADALSTRGSGYVRFGTTAPASYVDWETDSIKVITPALNGMFDISVFNNDLEGDTLPAAITFVCTATPTPTPTATATPTNTPTPTPTPTPYYPVADSVRPASGAKSRNNDVDILGTLLSNVTSVFFGTKQGTIRYTSNSTVGVTTPNSDYGTVSVYVTNSFGLSDTLTNAYTYDSTVFISLVAPSKIQYGRKLEVSIYGSGFRATIGAGTVVVRKIDNTIVQNNTGIKYWSDTLIIDTIGFSGTYFPVGYYNITVTRDGGATITKQYALQVYRITSTSRIKSYRNNAYKSSEYIRSSYRNNANR